MPAEGLPRTLSAGTTRPGTGSLNDSTITHKSVLDKQRTAIEKLRSHNASLKEELLLENKFSVRPSNPGAAVLIAKLQDEADVYTRKIQLERRKVLMLQQQLSGMQQTLSGTRAGMGGIFSAREKQVAAAKQIKILEDRLDKAYIKYNEAVTYNKQLRLAIDSTRRARLMAEALSGQLDRELLRLQRGIADAISAAREAGAGRDRAQAETQTLRLQAEREHAACEEEWRQLTAIIDDDRRQRELARANEMAERERRTQELLRSCEAAAADKRRVAGARWNVGMSKVMAQNVSTERVRAYGEAFARIQEATGIQDIDQLVAAFGSAEDNAYHLFNYVSEVTSEVERLEDGIAAIQEEIRAHEHEARAAEGEAAAASRSTSARLTAAEARAADYERRVAEAAHLMSSLADGVTRLFEGIGCDTPAVRALLSSTSGGNLSASGVLSHLGVVEQRSNELLQAYALGRGAGADSATLRDVLLARPQLPPAAPLRLMVDPPSTHDQGPGVAAAAAGADGASVADAAELPDDVPLSRSALQAVVQRNLEATLQRTLKVKPGGLHSGSASGNYAGQTAAAMAAGGAGTATAMSVRSIRR